MQKPKTINLQKQHSFHINLNKKSQLYFKLVKGTAEIWGEELPLFIKKTIKTPNNFVIFTWNSCQIQITANIQLEIDQIGLQLYDQKHPFLSYQQPIKRFYQARLNAKKYKTKGPHILITGKPYSGSNIVAKYLINHACKYGAQPIFIDLNVNNEIGIKGTIGMVICQEHYPADFFDREQKLIYYTDQLIRKKIFIYQSKHIKKLLKKKFQVQFERQNEVITSRDHFPTWCSGAIINIPSLSDFKYVNSLEVLKFIIEEFEIDNVVVIAEKTIQKQLSKEYNQMNIFYVNQMYGIQYKQEDKNKIGTYFLDNSIRTSKIRFHLSQVHIYKIQYNDFQQPYLTLIDFQSEIVKAIIAIVKIESQIEQLENNKMQKNQLARQILITPIVCFAQIALIEERTLQIEMLIAGNLENALRKYLWVYSNVSYS